MKIPDKFPCPNCNEEMKFYIVNFLSHYPQKILPPSWWKKRKAIRGYCKYCDTIVIIPEGRFDKLEDSPKEELR